MATRRESVVLSLQDDLSPGMLRAAAATKLLDRELNSLSGTSVQTSAASKRISRDIDSVGSSAGKADGSINQLTGRLRVLGEVAAVLGPSLVPIGGVAIAGIAGLSNQLGFAAIAGGVLIGSMQGLGDALDALNKAQLEPTAENLAKAEDALNRLSPAAADFARELSGLMPTLRAIRDMGAEELFPGLSESLDNLERLGPRVGEIFAAVAGALGDIAADSTASLASERWSDFFLFIRDEAPRIVSELAATVGDLAHGFSELWMAFKPLNDDFSSWLMDVASGFDSWATGLDQTQGFQEFIDYIRETGPQVAETFGAIGNALVQIVQATAPLGGPVLQIVETFADALGTIADSDLGTPILGAVAALSLLNRSLAVTASLSKVSLSSGFFSGVGVIGTNAAKGAGGVKTLGGDIGVLARNYKTAGAASERMAAQSKLAATNIRATAGAAGKAAAPLAGLAIASSGVADGLGLSNTASLALMGTIAGPWGAAVGGGIGLLLDWKAAGDNAEAATAAFNGSLQNLSLDQLNASLSKAQGLLSAIGNDDGPAGELIRGRIGLIEDQIDVTESLEAAQLAQEEADRGAAVALAQRAGLNIDVSNTAEQSVEAIKRQTKAYEQAQQAAKDSARGVAQSFFSVSSAVDAAEGSLDKFLQSLEEQSRALAQLQESARKAGKRGLRDGLINELEAAGPAGAVILKKLANGTEEEIGRANRAYKRGQDAIRDYVNTKVPPKKITVEQVAALSAIERVRLALANLRDKTVTVRVTQTGASTTEGGFGPQNDFATGGFTGAGGRLEPAGIVHRGEVVIPQDLAKRDWSMLSSRYGHLPGFADGGVVGKKGDKKKPVRGAAFYATNNTDALQAAIDRLTDTQRAQTEALEESTSQQEYWASKMSDLAQATVSGFNTGLFDRDSNPWAAGAGGGPISNLLGDIAGLNERQGLQAQLAGMGLSGDTLAALLSQGSNSDISALINSGQVGQYADLYGQRANLQASVGAGANSAAGYTQQAAAAAAETAALRAEAAETNMKLARLETAFNRNTAAVERMEQDAPERTGAAVGREINSGAATAQRTKQTGVRRG